MQNDVYCNPLNLPDLGPGICCRLPNPELAGFCNGKISDFREISDPEMLYYDGTWYMFPSVRQVYVSKDLAHWEYHPIGIETDLGYAPSVVFCHGRFLLTASQLFRDKTPRIYSAPTPLGPYTLVGEPRMKDGTAIHNYVDPSLFADTDGRLYLFWGCAPTGSGIYGMEMNPENPLCALSEAVRVIEFHTENEWEHYGEYHEHTRHGWDEGVSLFKQHGEYYLQYAACGTNFRNYNIACYRSSVSPLGPYLPPKAPFVLSPHSLVNGSGHGGMVAGPNDTVWQFYTCSLRRLHIFERRIGMDRVDFDAEGNPHVRVTCTPQSVSQGDLGLVPVSVNKRVLATSNYGFAFPTFAIDDCSHTWWEPAPEDTAPAITVDLGETFDVQAFRVFWTEPELDYANGKEPEPVCYKVEFLDAKDNLLPGTSDHSGNTVDQNVEFVMLDAPVAAKKVRLTILREHNLYRHGLTDFTVFAAPGGRH